MRAWEAKHGQLPDGGWLLLRTGWDARSHAQEPFLNADESGPHTPGLSPECARWVAEESPVLGLGVETVGTDAGRAHSFDPAFPCHSYLMGSDKYGLTQLRNLGALPPTGAVVVAGPLPIVTGSGPRRACSPWWSGHEGRGSRRTGAGRDGRRPCLRGGRFGELPPDQRPGRGGRAVRRRTSRGRRGDDGRRVRANERQAGRAERASGPGPDQRRHRDHRGRKEPHSASRTGGRGHRAEVQLLCRPGGPRAGGGRGVDAGHLGRGRGRRGLRRRPPRPARTAHDPARPPPPRPDPGRPRHSPGTGRAAARTRAGRPLDG